MELDTTTNHYVPKVGTTAIDLLSEYRSTNIDNVKRATSWFNRYGQDYHTENIDFGWMMNVLWMCFGFATNWITIGGSFWNHAGSPLP